jgi:peptidoglycan/LPS O-acetylase OafA/YrhL
MKKYELIEFLKGYAILTIVVYHLLSSLNFSGNITKAIQFGGTGVHAFLLVSGFGLYLSFLRKPLNYSTFLNRRLTKVYTPYIIIVLLSALLTQFIPLFKSSWYALAGHVFLYKMFDNAIIGSYGGHFWFISTIIQFYLIFHLLAWLKKRTSNLAFLAIGIGISLAWGIIITLLDKSELRNWNSFCLQYAWEFMLGMVIANLVFTDKLKFKFKYWHFLLMAGFCLPAYALLALKAGNIGKVFNDIPALIGYLAIAVFIYNLKLKPLNKFLLHTSKISYSFFLIHILINTLIINLSKSYNLPVNLITILISFLISYVLAHLFSPVINKLFLLLKT